MYTPMRDNSYLENLLYTIWEEYFADIPRQNLVLIKFGKHSKRQLGSISLIKDKQSVKRYIGDRNDIDIKNISVIRITRYFAYPEVPEFLIVSTIAHELCHYAHGFNSPLSRKYSHPHKGGVVTKELKGRGLYSVTKESKVWLKENWRNIVS